MILKIETLIFSSLFIIILLILKHIKKKEKKYIDNTFNIFKSTKSLGIIFRSGSGSGTGDIDD